MVVVTMKKAKILEVQAVFQLFIMLEKLITTLEVCEYLLCGGMKSLKGFGVRWAHYILCAIQLLMVLTILQLHHQHYIWHTPRLLDAFNCESKDGNNGRIKSWGAFLGSQHFGGKGVCWSSRMGTKKNDKQVNYSHGPT